MHINRLRWTWIYYKNPSDSIKRQSGFYTNIVNESCASAVFQTVDYTKPTQKPSFNWWNLIESKCVRLIDTWLCLLHECVWFSVNIERSPVELCVVLNGTNGKYADEYRLFAVFFFFLWWNRIWGVCGGTDITFTLTNPGLASRPLTIYFSFTLCLY